MIFLCAGEKGGCTKTTTAVNLLAWMKGQGMDVAGLDADPKPALKNWSSRRKASIDNGLPIQHIRCERVRGDILLTIQGLAAEHEHVVVDAGGADSEEQRAAMLLADVVILPFQPSVLDTDTAKDVHTAVRQAKALNRKLQAFVLPSNVDPNAGGTEELLEMREYFSQFDGFQLLKSCTRHRKPYRSVMKSGIGVVEYSNAPARAEMQLFCQELFDKAMAHTIKAVANG